MSIPNCAGVNVRYFDFLGAAHLADGKSLGDGRTTVVGLENYISIYTHRHSRICTYRPFPPFGMSRAFMGATHLPWPGAREDSKRPEQHR